LNVTYDRKYHGDEEDEEDEQEGRPRREFYASEYGLEWLGEKLVDFRGVRGNVFMFYQTHFIPDCVLDKQLALARAAAAGVEVERPVVIPYTDRHGYGCPKGASGSISLTKGCTGCICGLDDLIARNQETGYTVQGSRHKLSEHGWDP
jgi:hypothetical protein